MAFIVLVTGVYAAEGLLIVSWIRGRVAVEEAGGVLWHPAAMTVHVLAILGVGCMAWGYFVEPYWLENSRVELTSEKLNKTSLRIVHLSDLHCDPRPRNEPKLGERINSLKPDIIVFTGDAVNSREAVPLFRRTMQGLEAKLGKFAVRGNIDIGRPRDWDLFEGTGFDLLDAEAVTVEKDGETVQICGLNPLQGPGHAPPGEGSADAFTVFLHHYPSGIDGVAGTEVDLYLCGHTHGGQVALPLYGAIITLSRTGKKYERGHYRVESTDMYVSRGIGMEGGAAPRVRFWSRPEVVVIDVRPASVQ